jgi:hypothetical protein
VFLYVFDLLPSSSGKIRLKPYFSPQLWYLPIYFITQSNNPEDRGLLNTTPLLTKYLGLCKACPFFISCFLRTCFYVNFETITKLMHNYFINIILQSSTYFEHYYAHLQEVKLYTQCGSKVPGLKFLPLSYQRHLQGRD